MSEKARCPRCGDSGWRRNYGPDGKVIWLPFMNDALPCECGALARNIAAERARFPSAADVRSIPEDDPK